MPITATAAPTQPRSPRATRPLYLKRVPAEIWARVHVNAIHSNMRLTDYLVAVLASVEPITGNATPATQPQTSNSTYSRRRFTMS